ncbi:dual OB domain-containing protein [Aerosakkonema funiforme]|uniref:Dual OB-containing domain-containing protein n=2 Tax=Aerosakkonema funiforme TaxID=1246630 RepID=A0A926ZJT3_9CYAN|nr:hypothetical protein [Aerosakkonema funiforme FACHB-1375]
MTRIICLANSWKRGERCIAGITPMKGQWIRAVSDLPDGKVTKEMRLIGGTEPGLLDILEIPLAKTGPDYGFESENLSILPGKWMRSGQVPPAYLLQYCSKEEYILHNDLRYVEVPYLQSLPLSQRRTLELVKAVEISVKPLGVKYEGSQKWSGTIVTENNQTLTTTITDPVFVRKLDLGYRPKNHCLVTVSLSMPWRPPDWERGDPCWKLIAGVIELPDSGKKKVEVKSDEYDELPF